jgi:hypothetical protein
MTDCQSCNLPDKKELNLSGSKCGIINEDPLNDIGNCQLDEEGRPILNNPPSTGSPPSCVKTPYGVVCPASNICTEFDLSTGPESCLISSLIEETLNIGGADINVYKILGVHEQGSLTDLTGTGAAIASSYLPGFEPLNAFDKYITEWRSQELGRDVINKSYIGYDFGPIRLDNGRLRYGIDTYVKKDVTRIRIKQNCSANRVTTARLERSNDGHVWYGAAIIQIPDCDGLVTISVKKTVPSRWWRLRPLSFNGGPNDYWSVQALQFIDYEDTHIYNIQDRIFLENRDIEYALVPIKLKAQYTPLDIKSSMSKWGQLMDDNEYAIEVSFNQAVTRLGRPFVIGDIIELPSETQYTSTLRPVKKYVEVQSVGWSVNSYTPNWRPTMQTLICTPALASTETRDVFGKNTAKISTMGLSDIFDGNNEKYQDLHNISQTIKADANTMVPQEGSDYANVPKLSDELLEFSKQRPFMNLEKLDRRRDALGIDALPPNGLPYTEGDEFPKNPQNGDYHRLTYTKLGTDIPARLYRWSSIKNQWIFLERDRRKGLKNAKSALEELKSPKENSTISVSIKDVDKTLNP